MATDQTLPLLWLLSDARNDARLETALERLPRGSAFVFRHYHLALTERRERFDRLSRLCRRLGHMAILSDDGELAREWGAEGVYGDAARLSGAAGLLRMGTAHDAKELEAALAAGAHGIFLSPVFATASHPGSATLGEEGFNALAKRSPRPVIALGGMTAERAALLDWPRWAAIDGLS